MQNRSLIDVLGEERRDHHRHEENVDQRLVELGKNAPKCARVPLRGHAIGSEFFLPALHLGTGQAASQIGLQQPYDLLGLQLVPRGNGTDLFSINLIAGGAAPE